MLSLALLAAMQQETTATISVIEPTMAPQSARRVSYAIEFKPSPGWHLYYSNPGDSGLPPTVKWELPDGWTATELRFPAPEAIEAEGMLSYGYKKPFYVVGSFEFPADQGIGTHTVKGTLRWMGCMEMCTIEQKEISVNVRIQATPGFVPPGSPTPLATALDTMPQPLEAGAASVLFADDQYRLTVTAQDGWESAEFFPGDPGVVANQRWVVQADGALNFRLAKSPYSDAVAERLRGVILVKAGEKRLSFAVDLPVGQVDQR